MLPNIQQKKLFKFLLKYKALLEEFNYTLDNEDGCLIDNTKGSYLGFVEVHPDNPLNLTITCTTDKGKEITISTLDDI